jgi:hypothetical protein
VHLQGPTPARPRRSCRPPSISDASGAGPKGPRGRFIFDQPAGRRNPALLPTRRATPRQETQPVSEARACVKTSSTYMTTTPMTGSAVGSYSIGSRRWRAARPQRAQCWRKSPRITRKPPWCPKKIRGFPANAFRSPMELPLILPGRPMRLRRCRALSSCTRIAVSIPTSRMSPAAPLLTASSPWLPISSLRPAGRRATRRKPAK